MISKAGSWDLDTLDTLLIYYFQSDRQDKHFFNLARAGGAHSVLVSGVFDQSHFMTGNPASIRLKGGIVDAVIHAWHVIAEIDPTAKHMQSFSLTYA
jgi:hypothetical protein